MTSDEMLEAYKRIYRNPVNTGAVAVDISIEPLLRSHPEQLDDFLQKLADFLAGELAPQTGESQEELRTWIYEQQKTFLTRRKEPQ